MNRRNLLLILAGIAALGLGAWWLLGREEPVGRAPRPRDAAAPTSHHVPLPTAGERREPNPNQASTAGAEPGVGAGSGAAAKPTAEASSPGAGPAGVDGTSCDDGNPCTFDDRLHRGTCVGKPLHCDDDNPWTVDSCTGEGCLHAFMPEAFGAP